MIKKFFHNNSKYLVSKMDKDTLIAKEEDDVGLYLVIKSKDFFMFENGLFSDRLTNKSFSQMVEYIDHLLVKGCLSGQAMRIRAIYDDVEPEYEIEMGLSIDEDLKQVILKKYSVEV